MKKLFFISCLIFLSGANSAHADDLLADISSQQWRHDVDYLVAELPRRHSNWFELVEESDFRTMAARLRGDVGKLSAAEYVVRMMELVASAGDESSLIPVFRPPVEFDVYPLQTYWFADGLYIVGAGVGREELKGMRIARIGGHDIDDVFRKVAPVISAENEQHKRWWFSLYGLMPKILATHEIIDDDGAATFTLVDTLGVAVNVDVDPVPFAQFAADFFLKRSERTVPPMFTNMSAENYWMEYRGDSRTIVIRFNQIVDQEEGSLLEFAGQIRSLADTVSLRRVIVDLRGGGGGNHRLLDPLVTLFENGPLGIRGRLFTLIGRKTSGTLLEFASMMEYRTPTFFVGEPTGEGPNSVGASESFVLPETGIKVFYNTRFWRTSIPEDKRRWIEPDVRVYYTHDDYIEGVDPWMDAAYSYQYQPVGSGNIAPDVAAQIEGRYGFSSNQILTIERDGNGVRLRVDDGVPGSLFQVRSALSTSSQIRFEADIRDVSIDVALEPGEVADQLFVDWKGHKMTIKRAPFGYRLPMEIIVAGDYRKGVAALLDKDSDLSAYGPGAKWFLAERARRLLESAHYESAVAVLNAVIALEPGDSSAWLSMARAHLQNGDRAKAVEFCRRALTIDPENAPAAELMEQLERE